MTDKRIGAEISFGVDGREEVADLADGLEKVDAAAKEAADGLAEAGQGAAAAASKIDKLEVATAAVDDGLVEVADGAKEAADGLDALGKQADQAGATAREADGGLKALSSTIDSKTAAIKAALAEEQSAIELQRQTLSLAREAQLALARSAEVRGDEAAATQAQNRLREIEAQQLGLVARTKRAEADAIQNAAAARRQELATIGPLTAAQTAELRAADNHARALRTEAAAATVAERSLREMAAAHKDGANAADQTSRRLDGMTGALGRMAGALSAAFTFRELVTAAAELETLRSGLTAVSGDAQKAGQELEFVRAVAARIGADVMEVGKAFLGLSAATRGTAVEGEPTRQVFDAVATAMGKAGKSSAETANALNALGQMASKGVVQSEELVGQLSEALPGALNAAAKGLGITTQELRNMVESGQVLASDLFPALAKGLDELYGGAPQAQTLSQEIANIKNAVTDMASNIGESGGLSALKTGAEVAQTAIVLLDATLVAAGKSIGVVMGAIRTLDFSGVKQAFAEIDREAEDKMLKAAKHNDVLRGVIKNVGDESLRTRLAQQEQAAAAQKSGDAAGAAAPGWLELGKAYKFYRDQLEGEIKLAEKSVEAIKARGDAAIAEARLKGDEALLRKATGDAAKAEANAIAQLAEKRQVELTVLRAELERKQALTKAMGDAGKEREKEIKDLQDLIDKKEIEAVKTRAQAAESKAHARAKGEEVQAAQAAVSAAQASAIAKKADSDATISLLQTQKALAGQAEEMARLMGDEETARMYRIKQLEIDIEITKAKAAAMRAEAEGSIAVAEATMVELRAKGDLTPVKEAELNASIKVAQAKMKEADAVRQSAGLTQQAVNNLREFGDAAGRAGNQSKAATDKIASGWRMAGKEISDATLKAAQYHEQMNKARPGAAQDTRNEDGRYSSRGEELGKGVMEVGSGGHQFMNKDNMASDAKGNVIGSVESEAQMNQRVAALFGQGAIGMKEAIDAANIKIKLDEVGQYGAANVDGNGEYYDRLRKEYARLDALVIASGKSGNGSAVIPPGATHKEVDERKEPKGGSSVGGGGGISSGSGAGGAQYVTYLSVNGQRQQRADFKDAKSQSVVNDFLRDTVDAQRRAA